LYWGVGNPAPDFDASVRPGDNLYSNSMLAIDARTGKLAWHFQFTPGDDHDFDSGQTPLLVDVDEGGATRKLLVEANRNGFFYVLDRANGHFIRGAEFAKQTWAAGLSPSGRPILREGTHPTPDGVLVYPSVGGAVNWWPNSYSPFTGLYYVLANERGSVYFSEAGSRPSAGKLFVGGGATQLSAELGYTAVRAIDPKTAAMRWEHRNRTYNDLPRGGLLSTAGGLVLGSDTSTLFALDATTGALLWSFDTGGQISAAPISFRADGRQVLAVAAGQLLIAFELPRSEDGGRRP
jgi:alcohol dehydrogenase (cytochrome c)